MYQFIKRLFYFPIACYFALFAKIRLFFWRPKIVVVTGSSGKTTLLHLIESQVGAKAKYSHHANSSYGIPFDILGLGRKTLSPFEWPFLFILAPFMVFGKLPRERIYVVEADCDRPFEGKFLSYLLSPNITLWTNSTRTHSQNFKAKNFETIEEEIAHEYGYFLTMTKTVAIINADSPQSMRQVSRARSKVEYVSLRNLLINYEVDYHGTRFILKDGKYVFPFLLPKPTMVSILLCLKLLGYLGIKADKSFKKFKLPPGRNSMFKGIRETTLIDSTYNANLDSMTAVIEMFDKLKSQNKWMVLGDMLEQGKLEEEEHKKLAKLINRLSVKRVILMGPRLVKYTYPELLNSHDRNYILDSFLEPKEVLEYLRENIKGGEIILFKGARFMEGVVEKLLKNKGQATELARREAIWEKRRKKWGV